MKGILSREPQEVSPSTGGRQTRHKEIETGESMVLGFSFYADQDVVPPRKDQAGQSRGGTRNNGFHIKLMYEV